MRRDVGVCLHFYPACQRPLTSRFGRCSRRATVPCAPAVHSEPAVIHVRSTRCAMAARSSSSPAASSVSSSPPPLKMSRIWSGGQKGAPRRVLPADGSGVPPADHARAAHGGHRPAARRENPTARSSFAAGIPLFTRLSTRWRGATPHGRRHDDPRLLSRKKPRRLFPSTVTNSDSDVALEALRIYSNGRGRDWQRVLEYSRVCRVENVMRPYLEAVM